MLSEKPLFTNELRCLLALDMVRMSVLTERESVGRSSQARETGHLVKSIDKWSEGTERGSARGRVGNNGRAGEPATAAGLAAGARRTCPLRYQSIDARRERARRGARAPHSCRGNSWRPSPVNMNRPAPSAVPRRPPRPVPPSAAHPFCAVHCPNWMLTLIQ